MITLDTNMMSTLTSFGISTSRINEYQNKSLEEILEAEAANGNQACLNYLINIATTPDELIDVLDLSDTENKYEIIKNFNEEDLQELLPYLEKDDLINGLQFFNKESLLDVMEILPKEELVNFLFSRFSSEKFISLLEEKEMNQFFNSDKITKELIGKFLPELNEKALGSMVQNMTGESVEGKEKEELLSQIMSLDEKDLKENMSQMAPGGQMMLIYLMTQDNPELFQEFEAKTLLKPFQDLNKEEILTSTNVLEKESLISLVDELPENLIKIVAAQVDTDIFANLLMNNYQDVLSKIKM